MQHAILISTELHALTSFVNSLLLKCCYKAHVASDLFDLSRFTASPIFPQVHNSTRQLLAEIRFLTPTRGDTYVNNYHLFTGTEENSEFCGPSSLLLNSAFKTAKPRMNFRISRLTRMRSSPILL